MFLFLIFNYFDKMFFFLFTNDGSDHKVQMMFLMKCHGQSSCDVVAKIGYIYTTKIRFVTQTGCIFISVLYLILLKAGLDSPIFKEFALSLFQAM